MSRLDEIMKRTENFRYDRFGMFIHWGIYSIPARGEWVRSRENITIEDYQKFFDEFNPIEYDPKQWAKTAKHAGMRYAVLTTKHHDGFCLFDSKLTDYKATNTPIKKDLIHEYVDAFRAEGLKVGFYYSLLDWHHPDYPKYGDRCHPMRENEAYKDEKINFDNYVEYMHGQVKELLTNYGKIDIIWFDFSYEEMSGEKWQAEKLVKMVRELQPDIIIDNRLDGHNSLIEGNPTIYSGDFASPEQFIPAEGVTNKLGNSLPWEACVTMNDHWGYASQDNNFKDAKQIIRKLVECVSKGGNLLMNVGPDAKGRIPKPSVDILNEVGNWMHDNHKSIYGCSIAELPKPEWGYYTQNGNKLYLHLFENPMGPLAVLMPRHIKSVRFIADGSERLSKRPWFAGSIGEDRLFLDVGKLDQWPNNPIDTVYEVELEG